MSSEPEPRPASDDRTAHPESDLPNHFQQVLDFVPEAVLEVDAEGKIVFANSRVEEVFGYRPAELLNQAVEILIPRELQTLHAQQRAAYSERPKNREMGSSLKLSGLRKDGTRFAADVALNQIRSEQYATSHTLAFVRDVTHLRSLEIAERELLDKTLLGVVMTLNSLMSLTAPLIFNRTQSIKALVSHMLKALNQPELWQYELSAVLCLIGCTTFPEEVFEKVWAGVSRSEEEERVFRTHPVIGSKLLAHIQRLEEVAEIIGKQQSAAGFGSGVIEFGVCLLQVAQHADRLLYQNIPLASILEQLRARGRYRGDLIDALASYAPAPGTYELKSLRISELRIGMILEENLSTAHGLLIAPKEAKINLMLIERIRNFSHTAGVQERLKVRCPA